MDAFEQLAEVEATRRLLADEITAEVANYVYWLAASANAAAALASRAHVEVWGAEDEAAVRWWDQSVQNAKRKVMLLQDLRAQAVSLEAEHYAADANVDGKLREREGEAA